MRGIKFKLKDGTFDWYDPVRDEDFQISETAYRLYLTYLYEIPVEDVEYYEWYDLCDGCGHEVPDYCRCEI